MKCLIFVQNYPPEIGPVRYTYDLANALNTIDNEVTVVTGIPHYPAGKKYTGFETNKVQTIFEDGVEVIRTPLICSSNAQPIKRILGFVSFYFSAIPHLIRKRNSDLVIVSIPPFTVLFLGILGKLLFRIRLVVLLRDVEPHYSLVVRGLIKNKFLYAVSKFLSKFYKLADLVTVVDPDQINVIQNLGLDLNSLKVIPHYVDLSKFNHQSKTDSFSSLENSNRNLIVIYLGTFGKCHSLPKLIESLISTEIAKLPIQFDFIGTGEDIAVCKKLVDSYKDHKVKISDPIPFIKVPETLNSADLLILSYNPYVRYRTSGAKFYEYLAAAKPILVIGDSTANEIVINRRIGWSLNSNNRKELYQCLKNILQNKSELGVMGKSGREYLIKNTTINSFRENWIEICKSLTN